MIHRHIPAFSLFIFLMASLSIPCRADPDGDWFRKHLYDRQSHLCYLEACQEWYAHDLRGKADFKKIDASEFCVESDRC